jgi:hypothetical protein
VTRRVADHARCRPSSAVGLGHSSSPQKSWVRARDRRSVRRSSRLRARTRSADAPRSPSRTVRRAPWTARGTDRPGIPAPRPERTGARPAMRCTLRDGRTGSASRARSGRRMPARRRTGVAVSRVRVGCTVVGSFEGALGRPSHVGVIGCVAAATAHSLHRLEGPGMTRAGRFRSSPLRPVPGSGGSRVPRRIAPTCGGSLVVRTRCAPWERRSRGRRAAIDESITRAGDRQSGRAKAVDGGAADGGAIATGGVDVSTARGGAVVVPRTRAAPPPVLRVLEIAGLDGWCGVMGPSCGS